MRTSTTHTSAHVALREATQALNVRGDGAADLAADGYQTLATDLAATLDAVASLLRSTGVGVRPNATTHGLLAVAEHVDMGASMAQQAGGNQRRTPPATHHDPERPAPTAR